MIAGKHRSASEFSYALAELYIAARYMSTAKIEFRMVSKPARQFTVR